jgi:hypothetical protein
MQYDMHISLTKELLDTCRIEKLGESNSNSMKLFQEARSTRGNFVSVIESFIRFCRDFGCDADATELSMKKAILASMKSIDVKRCMESVDPDSNFIDYNLIHMNGDSNRFGDHTEWIKIVNMMYFDQEDEITMQDIHNHAPTISFVVDIIEDMKLVERLALPDMLRIYILTNIKRIASRHAVELFCSNLLQRDVNREVLVFTALLADQRFDQELFTADVVWLFKHLRFDDNVVKAYTHFMKQEKNLREVMKQKQIENMDRGRVRLRDRIPKTTNMKWMSQQACSLQSQEALDSFNGWIARVRFPQITSKRMKQNAYFICAQQIANHEDYMHEHYPADVAALALQHRISIPEKEVICNIIDSVSMHVQPFDDLVKFRRECFSGFAQKDSRGLTWLQILQLYMCVYQYAPIWTHCWQSVLPILSHQIICDVEKFTTANPYNAAEVIKILVGSQRM